MSIIRNNNNEAFEAKLKNSIPRDLNEILRNGTYPLHHAINLGHTEMALSLLHARANPELKDRHGLTAYDYAILSRNPQVISILVPEEAQEALTNALNQANRIFFQSEAKHEQAFKAASKLKELIQDRNTLLQEDFEGLHNILARGRRRGVAFLSKAELSKADFSKKNRSKKALTPLHMALLSRDEEIVSTVLKKVNADDLLAKDNKGLTPLHYASMFGLSESLEAMLAQCMENPNFDINAVNPRFQYSLVNLAIAANEIKTLTILLQYGAKISGEADEVSPVALLCALIRVQDPTNISATKYLLAANFFFSIVLANYLPNIVTPFGKLNTGVILALINFLGNEALKQNFIHPKYGSLAIKGGVVGAAAGAFAYSTGLIPLIKKWYALANSTGVVPLALQSLTLKLISVIPPCFVATHQSFKHWRCGGGARRAVQCSAIHGLIATIATYKIINASGKILTNISQIYEAFSNYMADSTINNPSGVVSQISDAFNNYIATSAISDASESLLTYISQIPDVIYNYLDSY
ncbi:MAG: ankyrin repeat domain-containing protein [Chlamydiales bacterium]